MSVKGDDAIKERIAKVEEKLRLVCRAIDNERQKPFFKRKFYTCHFLNSEKRLHQAVLRELKWIVGDE